MSIAMSSRSDLGSQYHSLIVMRELAISSQPGPPLLFNASLMDVPRRAAPHRSKLTVWHALRRAAPRQGWQLEQATPRRAIPTPRF